MISGLENITSASMRSIDVPILWSMWHQEISGYAKDFSPFSTEAEFANALRSAERDVFRVLLLDGRLVGFYMLRGWDAGYERPSFGVFVGEHASGAGLGRFALQDAEAICRALECEELMLSVSKANIRAYNLYLRYGFIPFGVNEKTGHLMMNKTVV